MSERVVGTRPPTPPAVWLIVAAIGLSYLGFSLLSLPARNAIDFAFALIPARFDPSSPFAFDRWYEALAPVFGHAFLHVAWWHAALNAFFFFLLGRQPARRLGFWRFLALFFISAAGGAIAFVVLNWGGEDVAIGASGAVCGVFSAYYMSLRPHWLQAVSEPYLRNQFLTVFFVNVVAMGAAAELLGVPIAWEGHLGGFVGGALAWIALAPRPRGPWG